MAYTLELRNATQDVKNEILRDLYGATSQNELRYATTKNNAEILSAEGEVLIALLQSQRPSGPGCCHFATTVNAATQTITVRTSTGFARLVGPDNVAGASAGTGSPTTNITLTIPAVLGNRAYSIISTANSTGTTAFGNITLINANGRRINAFSGIGLSACSSLEISNNQLTSFSGIELSACTFLGLNDNMLTSFSGIGLSACKILNVSTNQLTSFNGTGLSACNDLTLGTGDQNTNSINNVDLSDASSLGRLRMSGNRATINQFILNDLSFALAPPGQNSPSITINIANQTAESLNMILAELPAYTPIVGQSNPVITIRNNPGSLTCDPSLAPAAWTVVTS